MKKLVLTLMFLASLPALAWDARNMEFLGNRDQNGDGRFNNQNCHIFLRDLGNETYSASVDIDGLYFVHGLIDYTMVLTGYKEGSKSYTLNSKSTFNGSSLSLHLRNQTTRGISVTIMDQMELITSLGSEPIVCYRSTFLAGPNY